MAMRTIICISVIIASLVAIPLAAQNAPSRRLSRAVVDPAELSGSPKKFVPLTPTKRAFAQSAVAEKLDSKDPSVLASVVSDITSFINQDSTDTDLYFFRATVACQVPGSNRDLMFRDISNSIKLWKPNENSAFDSLRNHYAMRAKIEFLLERYADAINDLDAGIRIDYERAADMFDNGSIKLDEPTAMPCMWSHADVNKLAELFPRDYRTALYVGLFQLGFSRWSADADFQPILKAFDHAAELNPSSALPSYFSATPYLSGSIGGLLSHARAICLEEIEPRTKQCLELDDIHRIGVRYLTKAIADDPAFEPAYALRAEAHLQLREDRQAIRDYTKALELDPKANLYGDRGLAEFRLKEYQMTILDYTKRISQGCEDALCPTYENRADVYLKLRDYPHAISDLGHAIRNFLAGTIYGFNIDQFRRMYPEYDGVADDVLCEKLRVLFNPEMSYADYSKQFLVNAKENDDFVLPELFLKRGDAYADMGEIASANREYDRVSAGFPREAEHAFTTLNGKRVRVRQ
jgi:tetratricopeptide (TPR) repeat protein